LISEGVRTEAPKREGCEGVFPEGVFPAQPGMRSGEAAVFFKFLQRIKLNWPAFVGQNNKQVCLTCFTGGHADILN